MPEGNEYLSKMMAAAAEAEKKKQQETTEEQKRREEQETADKERSIQESLGKREAAIGTAKSKHEEGQTLDSDIASARSEVQQFDELAPKIKELGIDDGEFESKHEAARNRVTDLEQRSAAAATQEREASDVVGQIESNPEVLDRLHEEALKENEFRDLQKSLEEKQKYVQERETGIEKLQREIAKLDDAIRILDRDIEKADLGLKWSERRGDFSVAIGNLTSEVTVRLRAAEQDLKSVETKLQNPPKKTFGLREDKDAKQKLEQKQSQLKQRVRNMKTIVERFHNYSNTAGHFTDPELDTLLQREVGQASEYAGYKFYRDNLQEIAKKLGRYGSDKNDNQLKIEKEKLTKTRAEGVARKDELVRFIDYVQKTELPNIRQEIEGLQARIAK